MNAKNKNIIPEHALPVLAKAGVFVSDLEKLNLKDNHDTHQPHRDSHYLIIMAEKGSFVFHLDFQQLNISEPTMMIISPGQVHHITHATNAKGMAIGFDPALIPPSLQPILEIGFNNPVNLDLLSTFFRQSMTIIALIDQINQNPSGALTSQAIQDLLRGLLSLIADQLLFIQKTNIHIRDRSHSIERSFQGLLKQKFIHWKQPSKYAAELAISLAYLNDTVKSITGKSVTAHIQNMNILEAKRLLYRTDLNIKEIGYQLGYDDPVYFGKLFKKITKITPTAFRKQIRE